MSQENVEVVRRVYDAVGRRDAATILELYDPEVEFRFARGTVADRIGSQHVYSGHAGLREFDSELREAFTNFETNYEELIDAGERVVSVSRYSGQGRESGVEVRGPIQFGVWTIQNGKVMRAEWFANRELAFDAAGLSGQEAMPLHNSELVRKVFRGIAEQDLPRLIELTDPEVEWRSFFAIGEADGVYRNHSGIERYVADLTDVWEFVRPEILDGVELGEVVLLVGRIHYRGRGSGAETEASAGWVLKFRDGKVVLFRAFRDPERVLEAAGLSE